MCALLHAASGMAGREKTAMASPLKKRTERQQVTPKAVVTGAGGKLARTLVSSATPAYDVVGLTRAALDITDESDYAPLALLAN